MIHTQAFGHELSRRRVPPTDFECYRAHCEALRGLARRDTAALRHAGANVLAYVCVAIAALMVAA